MGHGGKFPLTLDKRERDIPLQNVFGVVRMTFPEGRIDKEVILNELTEKLVSVTETFLSNVRINFPTRSNFTLSKFNLQFTIKIRIKYCSSLINSPMSFIAFRPDFILKMILSFFSLHWIYKIPSISFISCSLLTRRGKVRLDQIYKKQHLRVENGNAWIEFIT